MEHIESSGARQIGELAVHRESMQRVLGESPASVRAILDALLSAQQRDLPRKPPEMQWENTALPAAGGPV